MLVMMFRTRGALIASSIQSVRLLVVDQILLLDQFLVQNRARLLMMLLKDMAQKLLLLNRYGVVPLEKEPSRLSSASTRTSK